MPTIEQITERLFQQRVPLELAPLLVEKALEGDDDDENDPALD